MKFATFGVFRHLSHQARTNGEGAGLMDALMQSLQNKDECSIVVIVANGGPLRNFASHRGRLALK
jgi:hypothetical protein